MVARHDALDFSQRFLRVSIPRALTPSTCAKRELLAVGYMTPRVPD
jgi:hypothetical protein